MSKGTIRPLRCADRSMSGEVVYYRIIYNCYRVSFPWRSVIGTFTLFFFSFCVSFSFGGRCSAFQVEQKTRDEKRPDVEPEEAARARC